MRSLTFFILLTATAATLFAQDENISQYTREVDGFGGPAVKYTRVYGNTAIMFGARGGWIFNHTLIIGGGIYGIVNTIRLAPDVIPTAGPLNIQLSCFGLEGEYVLQPDAFLHYNFYTFLGAGAIRFAKEIATMVDTTGHSEETDVAFLLEPAVNVEMNAASWCRIMVGVSYRLAVGVSQYGLRNKDFTGPAATLTLKLGSF